MFSIEIYLDVDSVEWKLTEFVDGRRVEIDSGRENVVGDACFYAGQSLERFVPEVLR